MMTRRGALTIRAAPNEEGAPAAPLRHPGLTHNPVWARMGLAVQPKLNVSEPQDPLELQADEAADRVMSMSGPDSMQGRGALGFGTAPDPVSSDTHRIHRRADGLVGGVASSDDFDGRLGFANPLDRAVREFFEPRFGYDFANVRVYSGSRADAATRSVNALAFATGRNIVFGAGHYSARTNAGRRLLAHELSHVVQQGDSGVGAKEGLGRRGRQILRQAKPGASKGPPPVAGGNILYVGMNNFKPELTRLGAIYKGRHVNVESVTVKEEEAHSRVGSGIFDLTDSAGIQAFAGSLTADATKAGQIEALVAGQTASNRDDLAHLIDIYAKTENDNVDRLSRVVLSGHSYGSSVYNEDVKGAIEFKAMVTLAGIFPNAAAQTRHLLVLACLAGDEALIKDVYQKAFPNLQTFWGWTRATCPTGPGAAAALSKWSKLTDSNPTSLPLPPTDQANWAMGSYQTSDPVDAKGLMTGLRADESQFADYFNGKKAAGDPHSGFLFDYYQRARTAAVHTTEITGVDHDYAQLHADQSYRLRFWPGMVANFWKHFGTTVTKGYGPAKVPNYAALSRLDSLSAIGAFPSVGQGGDPEKAEAARLLTALEVLDATVLEGTWIRP
jgi:hypothetical protein